VLPHLPEALKFTRKESNAVTKVTTTLCQIAKNRKGLLESIADVEGRRDKEKRKKSHDWKLARQKHAGKNKYLITDLVITKACAQIYKIEHLRLKCQRLWVQFQNHKDILAEPERKI